MTVSDLGRLQNSRFLITSLQDRLQLLQNQASTGKKGTRYSQYESLEAINSLVFRRSRAQLESYTKNIDQVAGRTKVMDAGLETITDSAKDLRAFILKQLNDSDPQTPIITNQARAELELVQEKLNIELNGRYLFAGSAIDNPPYDNPAALDTNIGALVTANIAGAPTVAQVVNDARLINGADLGFSTSVLAATNVTARIDEGVDVDYTVLANETGFEDILRGMAILANLPDPTTQAEQDNFWTLTQAANELISDGFDAVNQTQGVLGNKSKLLEERRASLDELEGDFRIFIGGAEDADLAEVSLKLSDLDAQLQATYTVTASLTRISLVNFI